MHVSTGCEECRTGRKSAHFIDLACARVTKHQDGAKNRGKEDIVRDLRNQEDFNHVL
jgi:hypothetical protein